MNKAIFNINQVYENVSVNNQKEAFHFIAQKFVENGFVISEKKAYKGLMQREKEGSTGFNDGIAIPHAKIKEINKPGVFIIKFLNGVEWDSIDGSKVKVAIALAIPDDNSKNDHLRILSTIARKLVDDDFRNSAVNAKDKDELYELFSGIEI